MDITTDMFVDTNEGGPSEFYYPNELQPGSSEWSDTTFHADTGTDLPALAMDDSELRHFIEGQANSNTKEKTRSDMNAWKRFSERICESRTMECIPAGELDSLLAHFYVSTRKQDGTEYEPDTLTSFQRSFARYYIPV